MNCGQTPGEGAAIGSSVTGTPVVGDRAPLLKAQGLRSGQTSLSLQGSPSPLPRVAQLCSRFLKGKEKERVLSRLRNEEVR